MFIFNQRWNFKAGTGGLQSALPAGSLKIAEHVDHVGGCRIVRIVLSLRHQKEAENLNLVVMCIKVPFSTNYIIQILTDVDKHSAGGTAKGRTDNNNMVIRLQICIKTEIDIVPNISDTCIITTAFYLILAHLIFSWRFPSDMWKEKGGRRITRSFAVGKTGFEE